jgi:hypothetical protein
MSLGSNLSQLEESLGRIYTDAGSPPPPSPPEYMVPGKLSAAASALSAAAVEALSSEEAAEASATAIYIKEAKVIIVEEYIADLAPLTARLKDGPSWDLSESFSSASQDLASLGTVRAQLWAFGSSAIAAQAGGVPSAAEFALLVEAVQGAVQAVASSFLDAHISLSLAEKFLPPGITLDATAFVWESYGAITADQAALSSASLSDYNILLEVSAASADVVFQATGATSPSFGVGTLGVTEATATGSDGALALATQAQAALSTLPTQAAAVISAQAALSAFLSTNPTDVQADANYASQFAKLRDLAASLISDAAARARDAASGYVFFGETDPGLLFIPMVAGQAVQSAVSGTVIPAAEALEAAAAQISAFGFDGYGASEQSAVDLACLSAETEISLFLSQEQILCDPEQSWAAGLSSIVREYSLKVGSLKSSLVADLAWQTLGCGYDPPAGYSEPDEDIAALISGYSAALDAPLEVLCAHSLLEAGRDGAVRACSYAALSLAYLARQLLLSARTLRSSVASSVSSLRAAVRNLGPLVGQTLCFQDSAAIWDPVSGKSRLISTARCPTDPALLARYLGTFPAEAARLLSDLSVREYGEAEVILRKLLLRGHTSLARGARALLGVECSALRMSPEQIVLVLPSDFSLVPPSWVRFSVPSLAAFEGLSLPDLLPPGSARADVQMALARDLLTFGRAKTSSFLAEASEVVLRYCASQSPRKFGLSFFYHLLAELVGAALSGSPSLTSVGDCQLLPAVIPSLLAEVQAFSSLWSACFSSSPTIPTLSLVVGLDEGKLQTLLSLYESVGASSVPDWRPFPGLLTCGGDPMAALESV